MRTSKPISTISYNTDSFLRGKIEEWKKQGLIEFGMWIRHDPEADDLKSHCHVYLKPAKLIQTTDLETLSCEIDPTWKPKDSYESEKEQQKHEAKQFFKMMPFRITSDEGEWLLYAIHDPSYLFEKGLEREFVYSFDDIDTTCHDALNEIISRMNDKRKGRLEYRIIDCINRGMTWHQIVSSGIIPIRQIGGAKIMYTAMTHQADIE